MPKTTWKALTKQIISRENKIQAKKSPRKAERNPKGWTGIREETLNGDKEVWMLNGDNEARTHQILPYPDTTREGKKAQPHFTRL